MFVQTTPRWLVQHVVQMLVETNTAFHLTSLFSFLVFVDVARRTSECWKIFTSMKAGVKNRLKILKLATLRV